MFSVCKPTINLTYPKELTFNFKELPYARMLAYLFANTIVLLKNYITLHLIKPVLLYPEKSNKPEK